jgi:hypothetical protein
MSRQQASALRRTVVGPAVSAAPRGVPGMRACLHLHEAHPRCGARRETSHALNPRDVELRTSRGARGAHLAHPSARCFSCLSLSTGVHPREQQNQSSGDSRVNETVCSPFGVISTAMPATGQDEGTQGARQSRRLLAISSGPVGAVAWCWYDSSRRAIPFSEHWTRSRACQGMDLLAECEVLEHQFVMPAAGQGKRSRDPEDGR